MGKRFKVSRVDVIEIEENNYGDRPIDAGMVAQVLKDIAVDNEGVGQEMIDPNITIDSTVMFNYTETNESIIVEPVE